MVEQSRQPYSDGYISLPAYIDRLWDEHNRHHIYLSSDIDRTAKSLDTRMAIQNEFRAALTDQAATFVTRTELQTEIRALHAQIQSQARLINIAVGVTSVLILIVSVFGATLLRTVQP